MKATFIIARRDLAGYFNSPWGYGVIAAILLVDGLLFNAFALGSAPKYSAKVLGDFFYFSAGTTLIAAVILTMKLFAEEESEGTLVLLDTAPVTDAQVVWGKFLAGFGVIAILTLLSLYMPALIFVNGKVSFGQIAAGYVGVLAMGGAAVAIGIWASSLTPNQYVAGAVGGIVVVLFLLAWMLARIAEPPLESILSYVALYDRHYQPFSEGEINTESLVFYASLAGMFLLLSTRNLAGRRWR
jgi:ABC-2 type transport system permease protein